MKKPEVGNREERFRGTLTPPRRRLNSARFRIQGFLNPAVLFQFSERAPEFSSGLFASRRWDSGALLSLNPGSQDYVQDRGASPKIDFSVLF